MVTFPFGHIWERMGTKWHELARLGTCGWVVDKLTGWKVDKKGHHFNFLNNPFKSC
jgi:hypothetical protein